MIKVLKALVLMVGVMVVSGCASTYHSVLRTTDGEFRNIVAKNDNMRVYIEPNEFEDCLWLPLAFMEEKDKCVKINTSSVFIPALKTEGITVVDSQHDANVIVRLLHLSNGRGWDHFTTTTRFNINDNVVKIVARPHIETLSTLGANYKRDWDAGVKTTELVLTKLLKHNLICNNCTIEVKTTYSKDDGNKILTYRDNTGF